MDIKEEPVESFDVSFAVVLFPFFCSYFYVRNVIVSLGANVDQKQ